jgi:16S rRNA A1518/A1519 N6-dimethyltransferase RsmA/KsgA/DIM1 with predicted DNA glycosylase/AP lyase activity
MVNAAYAVKYDIPFVPSSDEKTINMMKLADIKIGEKAVDLGAGEGKLVMAMAAKGADTVGIEIDEERSLTSISRIIAAGLQDRARIIRGSFWEHDLSPYDLIVLYGVPSIMERLEKKIENEAKPTVRIVSNHFSFPNWRPVKVVANVYLYKPLIKR